MKTSLLTCFLIFAVCMTAFAQKIWLVDNTPGKPAGNHVLSSVQVAHDSAAAGDIIHIKPSETSYGNLTISKSIEIFGVGFNPDKEIPITSKLGTIYVNGNDVRISGLIIDYIHLAYATNANISNIMVDNCEINYYISASCCNGKSTDNLLARNNLFRANTSYTLELNNHPVTNAIITNNVFEGYSISSGNIIGTGLLIKNNLFISAANSGYEAFENIRNSTISNNIFYGTSPDADYTTESNVFNNNLSYSTLSDSLPPVGKVNGTTGGNGNTGSGNFVGQDPLFLNLPLTNNYLYSYDITPQGSSPLVNAGTDGTDIGPTGGTSPWDNTGVVLPLIISIQANDVVKQGDNLNVEVTAEGNN